jgi:hypothetical protein
MIFFSPTKTMMMMTTSLQRSRDRRQILSRLDSCRHGLKLRCKTYYARINAGRRRRRILACVNGRTFNGRVHFRHDLRFDLRFGACVDTPTQENALPGRVRQIAGRIAGHDASGNGSLNSPIQPCCLLKIFLVSASARPLACHAARPPSHLACVEITPPVHPPARPFARASCAAAWETGSKVEPGNRRYLPSFYYTHYGLTPDSSSLVSACNDGTRNVVNCLLTQYKLVI